jgi:DNA segregation ATPase FtsK/SpoIIIE-like protein
MFEQDAERKNRQISIVASGESSKRDLSRSMHNFLFMVIALCIVFCSVSLLSYSVDDNSFFVFNSERNFYENLCGAVGAYCAALIFFLFGSFAFPWLLTLSAALIYRFYYRKEYNHPGVFVAGLGLFSFFSFVFSYLINTYIFSSTVPSFFSMTGALRIVGPVGVVMVSIIGLMYSLTLLFDVTLVHLVSLKIKAIHFCAVILLCVSRFLLQYFLVAYTFVKHGVLMALTPVFSQEVECNLDIQPEGTLQTIEADFAPQEEVLAQRVEQNQNIDEHSVIIISSPRVLRELYFGKVKLRLLPLAPFTKSLRANDRFVAGLRAALAYHFPLPDDSMLIEAYEKNFDRDQFALDCKERGVNLEERLRNFGINGSVVAIRPGPVVTLYEYQPDMDVKISSIIAREDDLAMALKALSIRIVAPIPGTNVVGFEIANILREDVFMSELIVSDAWKKSTSILPLLLGVDTAGKPVVQDLTTMPHLLVAGSTGSGKSVCMHSLLFSLLSRHTPETLRLVLIDPKRLEFSAYAQIPHLLFPVVVDAPRTIKVLKWVVAEMEHRYKILAQACVRNIAEFNKKAVEKGTDKLAYLVVMIDELADLMIVAGKDLELQLIRIAQMARAAGIHMVIATQRPSVDVVTGLIKVNFPSRLGCRVSSKIDSRTILDTNGAEKLLGRGDMLFLHGSSSSLKRIHGAYVSESQVARLTDYLRSLGTPAYVDLDETPNAGSDFPGNDEEDELYDQALEAIKSLDEVSISLLQRRFRIGFNRSARLIEQLEADGLLAPAQGSKPRKVLKI